MNTKGQSNILIRSMGIGQIKLSENVQTTFQNICKNMAEHLVSDTVKTMKIKQ